MARVGLAAGPVVPGQREPRSDPTAAGFGRRRDLQPNRLAVVSRGSQWRRRDRLVPGLVFLCLLAVIPLELHSRFGHGDIDLYHRYAQAFWFGSPPLRALPLEYPPL